MKSRILNYLVLITISVLTLVSCESNNESKGRIAVILKDRNAYWEYVAEGVIDAAEEEQLDARIYYIKTDVDYEMQIELLKNLDPKKFVGIYICPAANNEEMKNAINALSSKTTVVVLETEIPGLENTKYIGMSNSDATRDLYNKTVAYSTNKGFQIPDEQTVITFDIANSPAVNERIASYIATVENDGHTIIKKNINVDGSDFETKFNEAIAQLDTDEEFYYFSPNAIVSDFLNRTLAKTENSAHDRFIIAVDITSSLLEKIRADKAVAMAQDNYGYGYEGIKLLFENKNSLVLDPVFINAENVDNPENEGFLNGL